MTVIRAAQFDPETKRVTGFVTCKRNMLRGDFVEVPDGVSMENPQDWIVDNGDLVSDLAPKTAEQVDAERDRRIAAGFTFDGRHYNFDERAARFIERSLRKESEKGWTDSGGSKVPMSKQKFKEFADYAEDHEDNIAWAAADLKAIDPIPANFADDIHWP